MENNKTISIDTKDIDIDKYDTLDKITELLKSKQSLDSSIDNDDSNQMYSLDSNIKNQWESNNNNNSSSSEFKNNLNFVGNNKNNNNKNNKLLSNNKFLNNMSKIKINKDLLNKDLLKVSNVPNFLTILRILLIIIIIPLLLANHGTAYSFKTAHGFVFVSQTTFAGFFLFLIAAITDFLDGYLARKFNWVTNFGKFWDPIADKILINSVLFCMASNNLNLIPMWIPIIFLIRDIITDGIRLDASINKIVIPANILGKIKTICLVIGICITLVFGSFLAGSVYYWLLNVLIILIAMILSIISGCWYIYDYCNVKFSN